MASDGKNIGSLSIEVRSGDVIMLGNAIRVMVVKERGGKAMRLKVMAPHVVLINYMPKRIMRTNHE